MQVDLLTLYLLGIGTLLTSAGMTFWEHRANPRRSKELRLLAGGFMTIAFGCALALVRRDLPGASGSALSNLVILSGYLLVLRSVGSLDGRRYQASSIGLLVLMAFAWAVWGMRWHDVMWHYVSTFSVAIVSAMTAREMLRCEAVKSLHARRIVVAVTGFHALLYAARALVLPWMVTTHGPSVLAIASKITIYEGVLYSVLLPMALLKLFREESHDLLLQESRTDYLTRLGNRRWFFEQGARLISDRRGNGPVCVLAFDLDRFKSINDLYGHPTGDKVLKSFAEVTRSILGPDVLLARIGGEEFAAVLAGDAALRARTLGETVARRFAETAPESSGSLDLSATVSIGLAQFEHEVPVLADCLAAADRALYRAKARGGNRVETAPVATLSSAA